MAGKARSNLEHAVEQAKRAALLEHIRTNLDLTVGELTSLGGDIGGIAKTLTVAELRSGKPGLSKGRTAKPTKGAARPPASGAVNTRTPQGRARYDAQILATLKESGPKTSAAAIRDKVGGTPLQVRTALNRLIESGKVAYSGRARATKYTAK
jgi:hypothetical protein